MKLPLMFRRSITLLAFGVARSPVDDWQPEFDQSLNGESASMLAQDARFGKLW